MMMLLGACASGHTGVAGELDFFFFFWSPAPW
jgi:hypothetical protein